MEFSNINNIEILVKLLKENKIKDLENVCRDLTIQVLNLTPIEEGGEKNE